jgi:hypothetical protein
MRHTTEGDKKSEKKSEKFPVFPFYLSLLLFIFLPSPRVAKKNHISTTMSSNQFEKWQPQNFHGLPEVRGSACVHTTCVSQTAVWAP